MNFLWSIVLIVSLMFSIAVPLFFGHGLIAHDSKWFVYSAICFLIAAGLMFAQIRFRRDHEHAHHH